jgi:hypothetical protein
VRWSIKGLARRLFVCLLQPSSNMISFAASIWLVVFIVVAEWYHEMFIILITLVISCTAIEDY